MNTDEYLKGLDSPMREPMREIAVELRGIVKGVSADIVEDIKWGLESYLPFSVDGCQNLSGSASQSCMVHLSC